MIPFINWSRWIEMVITIFASVLASSGFWTYVQHKTDKNSATTELLLGMAHDRIMRLGERYVERGYVTKDEYEDFIKYLWEPYKKAGGNGSGEKMKREIDRLPIRNHESVLKEKLSHENV